MTELSLHNSSLKNLLDNLKVSMKQACDSATQQPVHSLTLKATSWKPVQIYPSSTEVKWAICMLSEMHSYPSRQQQKRANCCAILPLIKYTIKSAFLE